MILSQLKKMAALLLALSFVSPAAHAQNIQTKRVSFAQGKSGAVVSDTITGDQIIDYVLGAGAGQRMVVDMNMSNPSGYFNVMKSGEAAAIYVGSVDGLHFDDVLPSGGDWVVRVYLMRSAARRNETGSFSISFHIGGAATTVPTADYADGNAGGPDFWQVVGAGNLNVRSQPTTRSQVIGRAVNGQTLRNLGCSGAGQDRWCHIESADGYMSGWVAGRYLRESGAPSNTSGMPAPSYEADAMGPDYWQVVNVPANDFLNIRTGPSAQNSIVARANNGEIYRNLGCQANGTTRWCHVESADGYMNGWASQAYLQESGAPSSGGNQGITIPTGSAVTPELYIRPTGEIEASWSGGCTVLYNPAGSRIQAGSSCDNSQLSISDGMVARLRR